MTAGVAGLTIRGDRDREPFTESWQLKREELYRKDFSYRPHAVRADGPAGRGGDAGVRRSGRTSPRTRSGVKVLKLETSYLGRGIATVTFV